MTSTILISGASGFIGQALTRIISSKGLRVQRLVRPGSRVGENDICHDLSDVGSLKISRDTASIIHLAQSRAYRNFPSDVPEMFRVNVAGTQSLLQAAAEADVKTFCLVSSGTVYEPFLGAMSEADALRPRSYLGASKAAAEMIANPFSDIMSLSILRLFSPYGPGQKGRLVPDLVDRVRNGMPIAINGDGDGMMFSPTYVDDICDVICGAVDERWQGTFNVASPVVLSIREAALTIGEQLKLVPKFERAPGVAIKLVPDLLNLSRRYDMKRFMSFRSGISQVLQATV